MRGGRAEAVVRKMRRWWSRSRRRIMRMSHLEGWEGRSSGEEDEEEGEEEGDHLVPQQFHGDCHPSPLLSPSY